MTHSITCVELDVYNAGSLNLIVSAFEYLSGLKINFHKSEIFCFGEAKEVEHTHSQLFGCKVGSYPFKYLGIPMQVTKLKNADWNVLLERIEKKLSSSKGKHLSVGGRLVLINSVLISLPMFMMSFFEVPRVILRKLDYLRSRFFGKLIAKKEI